MNFSHFNLFLNILGDLIVNSYDGYGTDAIIYLKALPSDAVCYTITKDSFFWDQSQDMNSSGFPAKKQASDWQIYLVYQLEAWQETTWTHVLPRISEKLTLIIPIIDFI